MNTINGIKRYGESKHYIDRPLCRFDIINYFIDKNNCLKERIFYMSPEYRKYIKI